MMLLTALGGTGQAFFGPAAEGMLLSSVDGEQAGRAFALFRMATQGAALGGAALGGALVAAVGPGWVLAVDAAAFAVAAAPAFLPGRQPHPRRAPRARACWPTSARAGGSSPAGSWLWGIVVQFSIANAVVGAADAVFGPLVARDSLGGAGPWGLALAAFGAGTVAGALLMTRWKPRRLLLAGTLCVFPLALPSAALAVPVPAGVLYVVMFVAGTTVEVFGGVLDDRAAPGDTRGQALPGLRLRLVRLGLPHAARHGPGRTGRERLRPYGRPVGLRRPGGPGHRPGAAGAGRPEPDASHPAGHRLPGGVGRCRTPRRGLG